MAASLNVSTKCYLCVLLLFLAILLEIPQVRSDDYCESYCKRKCMEYTGQAWLDCNDIGKNCSCGNRWVRPIVIIIAVNIVITVLGTGLFFFIRHRRRMQKNSEVSINSTPVCPANELRVYDMATQDHPISHQPPPYQHVTVGGPYVSPSSLPSALSQQTQTKF